jgi:hypothetical protein
MALLSFRGIDTPSLPAQGEQRRSFYFNIDREYVGAPAAAYVRLAADAGNQSKSRKTVNDHQKESAKIAKPIKLSSMILRVSIDVIRGPIPRHCRGWRRLA